MSAFPKFVKGMQQSRTLFSGRMTRVPPQGACPAHNQLLVDRTFYVLTRFSSAACLFVPFSSSLWNSDLYHDGMHISINSDTTCACHLSNLSHIQYLAIPRYAAHARAHTHAHTERERSRIVLKQHIRLRLGRFSY